MTARLHNRIKAASTAKEQPHVEGKWFNIRFCPDMLAGEQINIGVGFVDQHGTVHGRFTDDISRLQCLYDDRIDLDELRFLVDLTASQYDRASYSHILQSPVSPQIVIGEPSPASGEDIQGILRDFFNETVALASPRADGRKRSARFHSYSNEAVRGDVFRWIADHHSNIARRILPSSTRFTIRVNDHGTTQEHAVELPIRVPGRAAGSVVSAYCSAPQTAELRILQAAITLNTAIRHLRDERCGLFILRPGDNSGLPASTLARFDDMIDENVWKLRDAGVFVSVESSIANLGSEIVNWAA
ncbi:hypothetical protein V2S84_13445 [Azotobacter chroococcum]|nr:hypothetical protein [Azotobacter chroococcum]